MTTKVKPNTKKWEEIRKKCLEPIPAQWSALYYLNVRILGHKDLIPMTPEMHYALCLFAERATGIPEIDEARVQLIQLPRGVGKSTLITKGRAIQELLKHDDWAVGIANETQNLASKFLASIKEEFESNQALRAFFPERIPDDTRQTTWKADEIVIPRSKPRSTSPSVLATGAGGTVTGVHMDHWILDDLISQDLAENAIRGNTTEIEKMERWVTRLPPLLSNPTRDKITVICTPWYVGDTYDFIERYFGDVPKDVNLDEAPKEEFEWVLTLPDGRRQHQRVYRRNDIAVFRKPAYNERGESAFPQIWTTEELDSLANKPEGAEFFAANYRLEPASGLATHFDPDWLRHYELDGARKHVHYYGQDGKRHTERIRDLATWVSVDPAFSKKSSAARTAIVVVGTNGRELFLLEDSAERGLGTLDMAAKIATFARKYRPNKVFLETIASQAGLVEPIQERARQLRVGRLPIEELPSHSDRNKTIRILNLEPWFRRGLFYVHQSHRNFKSEYESFPRGQLKDVLDALSFMREEWEKTAGQDHSGGRRDPERWKQEEDEKIRRMKESLSKGGGY